MNNSNTTSFNIYDNSLNAIRLLAAFNVFINHFSQHYSPFLRDFEFFRILTYIPNVPIFFSISGFLLYQSWMSNKKKHRSVRYFLFTKFLRILPAVWAAFFFVVITLLALNVISFNDVFSMKFAVWALAQLSFLQIYNPDFLRGYGVGVINGSLWTISVIFQYYFLGLFIYYFLEKAENKNFSGLYILSLVVFSIIFRELVLNYDFENNEKLGKLLTLTAFHSLFFFTLGMIIRYYFNYVSKILNFKTLTLLFFIWLLMAFFKSDLNISFGNQISSFTSIPIILFVFVFSYVFPNFLSITKNINISFGLFIWHMIFINYFIEYYPNINSLYTLLFCIFFTILFSYLQLRIIEESFYNYILKKTEGIF